MTKSLTDAIKGILSEDTANMATLKAGSKSQDPTKKLDGEVEDLGGPIDKVDDPGIDSTKKIKKHDYPGQTPPVGQQPIKKLSEMKKDEEEDSDEDEETEDDQDEELDEATEFSFDVDMTEATKALFDGETLSEAFKTKATAILEATVVSKIKEYKNKLDEEFKEIVENVTTEVTNNLTEQVDDYLEHITENWLKENEVAVESSLRTELTEDFINGLKNLFTEHYIDVPDEKLDMMESLSETIDDLKNQLNEQIESNMELSKTILEVNKLGIIDSLSDKLTDVQESKFKDLAEAVAYDGDDESFTTKLQTIKESFFSTKKPSVDAGDENRGLASGEFIVEETKKGPMDKYVNAISRTLK